MFCSQPTITHERVQRRRLPPLVLAGAALLLLGGCKFEVAGFDCKKVRSDMLQVGPGQSCKFRYGHGDTARYVVKVMKPPIHGEATGEGKYLRYVAKPGFVGEDRLTIKVERRGIGHVQWETHSVSVKVGPTA